MHQTHDIFPLGCFDHRFCDIVVFYYVFKTRCAQIHLKVLSIKHWPIAKVVRTLSPTMIHHIMTIVFFSLKHVFPKFLTWLTTYFQHTCNFQMKRNCPCSERQGPMSMAFGRLLWLQHSNRKENLSVKVED